MLYALTFTCDGDWATVNTLMVVADTRSEVEEHLSTILMVLGFSKRDIDYVVESGKYHIRNCENISYRIKRKME